MIDAKPIRVLICDDHPMFRQGVRGLLDAATDLDVVAEAATGDAALELAASAAPDVVLMDIQIPVINGIEVTRRIVAADPDAAVLVLTMFDDDSSVFAAMRAGARGYVLKGAGPEELLIAVRAAARGEAIFSPQIARRLMDYFSALHPASAPASVFPDLTEREREILTHVARGRRNSEISRDLFISPKTVTNHITNILAKLQVADRTEAILRARDAGLA